MDIDLELPSSEQDRLDISGGPIFEPQDGLEFESKEEAYSFYREYARRVGFGITIKASRRSKKSGKFIDIKIACSRFGSKRESSSTVKPRPCVKTDCKASLHIKKRQDGKWFIYSFVKEHNHEICLDDFYYAIRGRNKQSGSVLPQKKGLQLSLDEGDVELMLEYFMCNQDENPNFFYALDLGKDKNLRSVLWVDAKGRHDYESFWDVVFFDTFYIREKYKIPFVPIVGVDHHFNYILLGCGLIGDETVSAYVWLMKTWLKAVGGKVPEVVITDQDKVSKEAVLEVFSATRHCFCLWHVLGKIPEKLESVLTTNGNFMAKLNKCIYRSWTSEEFEKRWLKMVERFELKEDEWVQSLYEDHEKWGPAYMRDSFLAGMSTTDRSGSVTSFYDKYLCRESTFKEFMEHHKIFTKDRYDIEATADFETEQQNTILKSLSPFEKQMSTLYTSTIFKKFQMEILGVLSCQAWKESEDEATVIYRVDDFEERQDFIVVRNKADSEVACLCRSFEYRGFLCRHSILVLQISGLSIVPSKYILKRWTRGAKIRQTISEASNRVHYRVQRFNNLCRLAVKLGEEGSLSQEAYEIALKALEEVLKQSVSVNHSAKRLLMPPNLLAVRGFEEDSSGKIGSKSSKKKRVNKRRKGFSESEEIPSRLQDNSMEMVQMNMGVHDHENCYVPRQDIQGVDVDSRASNLDSYYCAEQNMLGVGQMNSISPIHDGYYNQQGQPSSILARAGPFGTQQNMQRLLQGQLSFKGSNVSGCFDDHGSFQEMKQLGRSSRSHFHSGSNR